MNSFIVLGFFLCITAQHTHATMRTGSSLTSEKKNNKAKDGLRNTKNPPGRPPRKKSQERSIMI